MREVKKEDKGQVSGGEGQVMGEEKGRVELCKNILTYGVALPPRPILR